MTGEDESPAAKLPNAAQRRIQRSKINLIDSLVLDLYAKLSRDQTPAELQQLARLQGTLEDTARSLARESEQEARAVAARAQLAEKAAESGTVLARSWTCWDGSESSASSTSRTWPAWRWSVRPGTSWATSRSALRLLRG